MPELGVVDGSFSNVFPIRDVFSLIEKYTMQKKIPRHIKLAIHACSTKCG
jgi:hypothetical protein